MSHKQHRNISENVWTLTTKAYVLSNLFPVLKEPRYGRLAKTLRTISLGFWHYSFALQWHHYLNN